LPVGDPTAPEPAESRGVGRASRCAAPANGLFGYTLDVTGGRPFTLNAADESTHDFDILFYSAITLCHEDSATPVPSHTNVAGNESGVVPPSAMQAIVVLYSGVNGSFFYSES
jgi:hypothetical protein